MAHTPEPDLSSRSAPEEALRRALLTEIERILELRTEAPQFGGLETYFVLQDFGLDLAVFLTATSGHTSARFLELKAYTRSRRGGVGFGGPTGRGLQVDLLRLSEAELAAADQICRWILVDRTKPRDPAKFAFFSTSEARRAAMGGVQRGKQNNLNVRTLMSDAMTWHDLSRELEAYLCGPES